MLTICRLCNPQCIFKTHEIKILIILLNGAKIGWVYCIMWSVIPTLLGYQVWSHIMWTENNKNVEGAGNDDLPRLRYHTTIDDRIALINAKLGNVRISSIKYKSHYIIL